MAAHFCENCGDPVSDDEVFCEKCGNRIEKGQTPQASPAPVYQQPSQPQGAQGQSVNAKNPVLAAILSFLICGVGQMYNGQWKKGIVLLVVTIILAILIGVFAVIVVIYAIYDAYTTATKINNGEPVKDILS